MLKRLLQTWVYPKPSWNEAQRRVIGCEMYDNYEMKQIKRKQRILKLFGIKVINPYGRT